MTREINSNETDINKLRLFGRFPKANFDFNSQRFAEEYKKIISTPELTDKLLERMIYRYNVNELKKAAIMDYVLNHYSEGLTSEKICELFQCDKNTIFAIGQELDVSIRLSIQKSFYQEMGRNEIMIDEFGLTPRSFNYIYKRGCMTKNATVEAYKNGYISNDKVRNEISDLIIGNGLGNGNSQESENENGSMMM